MSQVSVQLFAAARAAVGQEAVFISAGTLGEVISSLTEQFPAFAAVEPRCSYLVDGVAAHGKPGEIMLGPDAQVDVLPPFAGG